MKAEELRGLSDAEVEEKNKDLQEELFNLKFQLATGQIENPLKIRQVRRDIARVRTILWERKRASSGRKA
ncbi:MAG: 50S ribosomal protein L29 [Candidatus Binatia bacterium]